MSKRIRVNPVACSGHGACAELLPELISLDDWGYPIVSALPVSGQTERRARRAVVACPALALILTPASPPGRRPAAYRGNSEPVQKRSPASRGKLEQ